MTVSDQPGGNGYSLLINYCWFSYDNHGVYQEDMAILRLFIGISHRCLPNQPINKVKCAGSHLSQTFNAHFISATITCFGMSITQADFFIMLNMHSSINYYTIPSAEPYVVYHFLQVTIAKVRIHKETSKAAFAATWITGMQFRVAIIFNGNHQLNDHNFPVLFWSFFVLIQSYSTGPRGVMSEFGFW